MRIQLDTPLETLLPNKRRASTLKRFGMVTVADALTYYPFRVTDPVAQGTIREAREGAPIAFPARVVSSRAVPFQGRYGTRVIATVEDVPVDADVETGAGPMLGPDGSGAVAQLVFFSHNKGFANWMLARLAVGSTVVVSGQPGWYDGMTQFTHPDIEVIGHDEPDIATALDKVTRPRPVYHATARFSSERIHESILAILQMIEMQDEADRAGQAGSVKQTDGSGQTGPQSDESGGAPGRGRESESHVVPTILPDSVRERNHLLRRFEALQAIHDPQSVADFKAGLRTMRYEEAFVSQVSLLKARATTEQTDAFACPRPEDMTAGFAPAAKAEKEEAKRSLVRRMVDSLSFTLTKGQKSVCADISADLAKPHPMQRLLQGEVGSGKTIVALLAMLQVLDAGYQAVLVAPTQVLAEQHYANISSRMAKLRQQEASGSDGDAVDGADGGANGEADGEADGDAGVDADRDAGEGTWGSVPPVVLLTGAVKAAQRRRTLALVASGAPCLVIATHAAFSSTFQAPRLALAIIDEQHRFGVEQRDSLLEKSERTPHLLVMTATPIPRTAAMTWFGDLRVSELEGLPGGRKPVTTYIVPEADNSQMARMFVFLRRRIEAGERAYVICPAIESTDNAAHEVLADGVEYFRDDSVDGPDGVGGNGVTAGGRGGRGSRAGAASLRSLSGASSSRRIDPSQPLHSVEGIYDRLSKLPQFQRIRLAHLTGRDDEKTKNAVMAEFESGETPLLVATTVIEVGVDVPQASCIVVFNADHFGLTQLHQLRGRVGRGGTPGWAFLVSQAEAGTLADQRLEVLRRTNDGREISEADINLRGAGDVLGDAQSGGTSSFKLLRVVKDARLIARSRADAADVLDADSDLARFPQLAGAVLDFMRGNEKYLTRS